MVIGPESRALAILLVDRFEGCELRAKRDPVGYWTIGRGNRFLANGQPVTEGMVLTQDQADALSAHTIDQIADEIGPDLPPWTTVGQAGALVDFAYNVGVRSFQISTLLKLFRAGDVSGAADQFARWVYAADEELDGLVARRAAERELFLSDTQAGADVVVNDGESPT